MYFPSSENQEFSKAKVGQCSLYRQLVGTATLLIRAAHLTTPQSFVSAWAKDALRVSPRRLGRGAARVRIGAEFVLMETATEIVFAGW